MKSTWERRCPDAQIVGTEPPSTVAAGRRRTPRRACQRSPGVHGIARADADLVRLPARSRVPRRGVTEPVELGERFIVLGAPGVLLRGMMSPSPATRTCTPATVSSSAAPSRSSYRCRWPWRLTMSTSTSRYPASVDHVEICDRLIVRPSSWTGRAAASSSLRPPTRRRAFSSRMAAARPVEIRGASAHQAVEVAGGPFGPVGPGGDAADHQVVDTVAVEGLREASDVRGRSVRQGCRQPSVRLHGRSRSRPAMRSPSPSCRSVGRPG